MGGLSIWHWLIIGGFAAVTLAVMAVVIWAIVRAGRRD